MAPKDNSNLVILGWVGSFLLVLGGWALSHVTLNMEVSELKVQVATMNSLIHQSDHVSQNREEIREIRNRVRGNEESLSVINSIRQRSGGG